MAAKARQSQRPAQPNRQPSDPARKSLKQSLKDVFFRTMRKSPSASSTIGSGILRRADATANRPYFPSTTTLSSFSALSGSQTSLTSLDEYTISRSIPNRFQSPTHTAPPRSTARQSLLPARSLSQFDLNHAYLHPTPVPRRAVHEALSPSVTSITSRQASIASIPSFATLSTVASVSTLRVQPSHQTLSPPRESEGLRKPNLARRTNHVSWLQSPTASSISFTEPATPSGVKSVEHFKSFCILDTAVVGCPVVATSRELCYIFDIGEHFFLNNCECDGASMDIVTGQDAAGDPVTHLVLFTPLIIPSSGRSRFMLACLIDVTKFINETATIPELDREFDSLTIESEVMTPIQDRRGLAWNAGGHKLSADDLLGGCMLHDDRETSRGNQLDDIWLNLANEETRKRSTARNTPRSTPKISQTPRSNASLTSTSSGTVDEVLDEFMSDLQELYSEFFLLGKSPLDDTCFEICNVSPMLFQARDYINGHLSRTDQRRMAELSEALAQGSPFNMPVKWGSEGVDKQLYCNPMYTSNSITWICFLVDQHTPLLW